MTRALVTGSTGFIGGALCAELVEKGFSVRAFHRSTSNLALIKDLPVEHVIGDLTQPASLESAMQGIDVVFHTAAMLGNTSKPEEHYAVTVQGTRAVLEAALSQGIQRFIHTSSIAALGIPTSPSELTSPEKSPLLSENSTWNIRADYWSYGYAKYLAEMEIQKSIAQGLDAVICNPSYVIGPGDIYRIKDSPFKILSSNKLPFIPTGGVNIVHIQDVVNGHLAALEYGKRGERYILGNENLTFKALIEKFSNITQSKIPKIIMYGKVLRSVVKPLQLFQTIIKLPVSIDLIRFAGYGFYVNNQKSKQVLHLDYQHSTDNAIREALDWINKFSQA
jgi:dihydroflavonol-4-reductase